MKSSEFITEASIFDERTLKNTHWKSPDQIMTWLKANGFEQKGAGVFARVFAKPNHNRIVKISTRQDDCWILFAQFAMSQTNNKHLPKIPWIKRYQGKDAWLEPTEFFITIIERLQPLTDEAISRISDPGVLYGILEYTDIYVDEELYDVDAFSSSIGEQRVKYKNHLFVKTLRQMENLGSNCVTDLHDENLMVRGDGTIVITDPLMGDDY